MRSLSTTPNTSKPPPSSRPGSRQSSLSTAHNPDPKGLNLRKKASVASLSTATPTGPRTTTRITATTTTTRTPATPRATRPGAAASRTTPRAAATPVLRTALRQRDQNVAPTTTRSLRLPQDPKPPPPRPTPTRRTTTPATSATAISAATPTMPFERASANGNTANRQPQMPSLARGASKQPLTPKIATPRSVAPHHQTVTVSTPLPRRSQRPESSLGGHGAASKERDDFASPVSAFLNNNITPRSGSRQSRVDSANSTPNGTPQPDRPDAWDGSSGLGISGSAADSRRPSVVAPEQGNAARAGVESKFFYASEAPRPAPQVVQPPRPFVAPQKQSSFVYANGNSVPEGRQSGGAPTFTPVLASQPSQDSLMSKFVYADGTSDAQSPVRATFGPSPGPGSVVSTSSKMISSRPGTGVSASGYMVQRPPSPVKHPSFPPPMGGTAHVFAPLRSPVLIPSVGSVPDVRRTSGDSAPRLAGGGHSRGGSIASNLTVAEAPALARLMSAHGSYPSSESSSPSTFSNPGFTLITSNPATSGFASLLQAADDFAGDEEEDEEEEEEEEEEAEEGEEDYENEMDVPQSPGKASSQENQLSELVASARRERKVQDLQITNASLEAINRTLERQLRKQTAELRRYRRLSRSGRISLGPLTGRDRITSDSTVDGGGLARAGLGLDDLSEEDSELEAEEEEEDDYSDSDLDSGELSPDAMATRDFRHRRRDEQRLQLDLSKHQQLLIDSQKMNQSLKRCLGWTEELIKEGKRALEYQVRVSEVNIGGRVLNPEDIEGHDDESEVVGDETTQELKVEPRAGGETDEEHEESRAKDPLDRDSGIELPTDGG